MKGVVFHQDRASAHKFFVSMVAVYDCSFALVYHPHCSPDLAGNHYHNDNDVISAVDDFFD